MRMVALYFRQKAAQCRSLAQALADPADPVIDQLFSMADEFDANARALETRLQIEPVPAESAEELMHIH